MFYADPVTWPGKTGRPGKHGMPVTCHNDPGQANPEPDETLTLPDTPRYGTVRVDAWHQVHPLIHGDRGWFAETGTASCPSCAAPCCASRSSTCPTAATRTRPCGCGTPGRPRCPCDELWRAYLARFDEEHAFKFAKGTLGLTAAKVRTPQQADRWVRLVMAAFAQLLLARPLAADLRRPWETRPPGRPPPGPGPGPPRVCKHPRPARHPRPCRQTHPARPGTPQRLRQRPGTPLPSPEENRHQGQTKHEKPQVKG